MSTRQLRSQGPVSVQVHHTEGVTGSEGQEGANGVGDGIGVEGGNGDGNGVGGGNGDVNGHGDGAGTGTEVEVNGGAQDGNGDGDGAGTGVETRRRTLDGDGDGNGDRSEDGSREGTGTEARTVAEMGTGTKITGTRIGSGRAEERRRSARNRKIVVDAMWEMGETWVERGKYVEKKGLVQ